jgi:hypothetical protein
MESGPSEEIIVIASPEGGGFLDYFTHPTPAQKESANNCALLMQATAITFGTSGTLFWMAASVPNPTSPELLGAGAVAYAMAAAAGVGSLGFTKIGRDPPQSDFRMPVRINRLGLSTLATGEVEVPAAQPLFDVLNDLIPTERGLLDAYERAQGADAAGDSNWAVKHSTAARLLIGAATGQLLQLAARFKQFDVPEFDDLEDFDQSMYSDLQDRARRHELFPPEVRDALLRAGVTNADVLTVEEVVANQEIASLPVGSFTDLIGDTADQLASAAVSLSQT